MPHKRNPVLCERVTGLSRVIKSNLNVALDNMTLWHERDISHSSAERVTIPDSTIAIDYLLDRMVFIIENMHVYPENMMDNINRTGGLFYSQTLLLKLVEKGMLREDAYRLVQDCAMRVWRREGTLRELIEKEAFVQNNIRTDELDVIFNLDRYLLNIGAIYRKTGLA